MVSKYMTKVYRSAIVFSNLMKLYLCVF